MIRKNRLTTLLLISIIILECSKVEGQIKKPAKDADTPLHMLSPAYPVPYGKTTIEEIHKTLNRIYVYLSTTTPPVILSKQSGKKLMNQTAPEDEAIFESGDFRLISYEWGVTYAGMLLVGEETGDKKFVDYTNKRLKFITKLTSYYKHMQPETVAKESPVSSVLYPHALDDVGAMCTAMIKAQNLGLEINDTNIIDRYINYITSKQYRLEDGTLARNRPFPNTLWLDDLFMSVPALAQMGKLTGDPAYFADATKQVKHFSERMFDKEKGLFKHGWVKDMEPHPNFYWGRANGWAIMSMVELLDVLPANYPERANLLCQLKAHIRGLAAYQAGSGFWHQLLDKNDSFLETSCTAIFTYSIAKAINRGWIDPKAYGPMVLLAWSAVASKVNVDGQVDGTCVGTGMGFDPAFYYFRPVNVYAAHSYGPVLLAGAEMIHLLKNTKFELNDSAVQFKN